MDQDEIRRHLEQIAAEPSTNGRQAMAKVTALRTLERLTRQRRRQKKLGPNVNLDDVAPADHWLQVEAVDDPWRALDRPKTFRELLRWRANLDDDEEDWLDYEGVEP